MRKAKYILFGRLLPCALLLALFLGGFLYLALKLPFLLAPFAALERVLSLSAAIFLCAGRLSSEQKVRRLLLLLLLPWLGLAILPMLGGKTKEFPSRPVFSKSDDATTNAVWTLAARGSALYGCHAQSAEYFPNGKEMFLRLLCDLESAKKEILLEYYILAHGKFFDAILNILEKKAALGVDVCLIYDDFGCATTLPRDFCRQMQRRGIKASAFHPLRAFPLYKLNRRDHRKIAVIDRAIAYTGGINLSDEYIGERIRFGHWKDTAVRLEGEPAERFAALFRERPSQSAAQKDGIPCAVFADRAFPAPRTGQEILFRVIASAQTSLSIFTPYLSPCEKIFSALCSAARAGVDVRVMIPHIPDRKAVFALTRSYARRLEEAGVKVREYAAGFLHAKCLAADGTRAVIGSYNLDGRSLALQAECGVYLKDEAFCGALERDFFACWEAGLPVPKASLPEKIAAFFLRLFSPLV